MKDHLVGYGDRGMLNLPLLRCHGDWPHVGNLMSEFHIKALDELLTQDPTAVRIKAGVPHPLWHFAINDRPLNEVFADILLDFIQRTTWEPDKNSDAYKHAIWFLLESEQAYFIACSKLESMQLSYAII